MHIRALFPKIAMSTIAKTLLYVGSGLSIILPLLAYAGYVPLRISDFLFFFLIVSLAAAYRPGWVFLLLVSVLPLETVNLAPSSFGTGIRPYQFLMMSIIVGLGIRFLMRRSLPAIPKPHLVDALLLLIPIGSLFAVVNASAPGASLRLSVILFTYYALYALFRIYIRSSEDVGRILPFFIVSSFLSVVAAIGQNLYFIYGNGLLEVMPGRPNAFFAEPDWLGMFLIVSIAVLISAWYMIATRTESVRELFRMKRSLALFFILSMNLVALVLSVSRSAWLGTVVTVLIAVALPLAVKRRQVAGTMTASIVAGSIMAICRVVAIPLTTFDLFGRAGSIGSGLQTITVSCERETALPAYVATVEDLASLGCRHIDLDEIDTEKSTGRFVTEINRNDPNISIRKQIYERSVSLGREHPVLGIGWGSVTRALGIDARGAGLNASDVFLEIWLGSGLLGIIGWIGFLCMLVTGAVRDFSRHKGTFPLFLLSAFGGLIVFDLFNSGILLGFFWALLGIAGSYLAHVSEFSETL